MNKPAGKKNKKPKTDPMNILDDIIVDYSNTSGGEQAESDPPTSLRSKRKKRALAVQSVEPINLGDIIMTDIGHVSTGNPNSKARRIRSRKLTP